MTTPGMIDEKALERWKKDDARISQNMAFAAYSFMLMGVGGLLVLSFPLWFPLLHYAVCQ